jgi:acyl-CoA synthetase (AMP-forming)/AMP-acid ligase II
VPTIPELVRRAVAAHPGRVAIVDGARTATFADVGTRTIRLANALRGLSAADGGRVAILMRNRLEYVEADLAIARAGKVKVPINPKLSDDERAYVLADSGADILITEKSELPRLLDNLAGSGLAVISADGGAGALDYEDALAAASASEVPLRPDPTRLSQLLYTSGTTGRPKGAMLLDECRVCATAMSLVEEFTVTPSDGMIHAGPLSHGSASKLLTFFVRGARNIVLPKFEPELFVRAVRDSGGTSSFVVPTMISMLVDYAATHPSGGDAWGLRNLTYGGASISRPVLAAALETLGPILTQVYGSCEAPHPVLVLRHRDGELGRAEEAVPAGRPAIGVDVRVTDSSGLDAVPGEAGRITGELLVKGPNVMSGYWQKPEATAESIVDGWYRTGDIVQVDREGTYTLVDRAKDIVITGGLNVYPAEVERVLRQLPGVAEVSVVGLPDDKWGELVTAVIVRAPAAAIGPGEVEAWCIERLAGYKKPRRVILVDDLPKGSTGKILKREVRDLAAQTVDAQ